jgi:predicted class III extradiol MEMO1 family dioxygenase
VRQAFRVSTALLAVSWPAFASALTEVTECRIEQLVVCTPVHCEKKSSLGTVVRLTWEWGTELGNTKIDSYSVEYCSGGASAEKKCDHFENVSLDSGSVRTALLPRGASGATETGPIMLSFDFLSPVRNLWTTQPLLGGIGHGWGLCSKLPN